MTLFDLLRPVLIVVCFVFEFACWPYRFVYFFFTGRLASPYGGYWSIDELGAGFTQVVTQSCPPSEVLDAYVRNSPILPSGGKLRSRRLVWEHVSRCEECRETMEVFQALARGDEARPA